MEEKSSLSEPLLAPCCNSKQAGLHFLWRHQLSPQTPRTRNPSGFFPPNHIPTGHPIPSQAALWRLIPLCNPEPEPPLWTAVCPLSGLEAPIPCLNQG